MKKLFVVRDIKADVFNNPFVESNAALAIRGFTEACLRTDNDLHRYPEDYQLYEIGTYDPQSATVESYGAPKFIASASGVLNAPRLPVAHQEIKQEVPA